MPHAKSNVFEEQFLDPRLHDRQGFSSGVIALDEYLQRFAVQQSKKGVAVVRVLVDTNSPSDILGYYSLSAAQIDIQQLDLGTQKKLPRYPVPCFRMGRLAVDEKHQKCGMGRFLMGCAIERCLEARKHVAAYALIVDAKTKDAKSFYGYYGFMACRDHPMVLYLPLGT